MNNDLNLLSPDMEMRIRAASLLPGPPTEEPERQYYFIARARELVKQKSKELGRPLISCSKTMGCQMNAERKK